VSTRGYIGSRCNLYTAVNFKEDDLSTLRVNRDAFCRLIRKSGLANQTRFARRIGVDRAIVSRVLRGEVPPGNRFIAGVWTLFGLEALSELFTTEEDKDAV
jgi:hypothetical protein